MAILDEAARLACWLQLMRENTTTFGAMTKTELRAAIDAADQWAEDNASAFNLAIPQPARGALSAKQKALLLMLVVAKRYGVL
jgi:hypothetical protein